MSTEVIVTYVNIVLYAISYQLQRPTEPFLVKSLINTDDGQSEEQNQVKTFGRLTLEYRHRYWYILVRQLVMQSFHKQHHLYGCIAVKYQQYFSMLS